MANLKAIRRRIGSVRGTQKITRAMKMVAAAKLRKAQEAVERFRAYADLTSSVLAEVATGAGAEDHPLLERRGEARSLLLVISADRGLCGGFNTNLNKAVMEHWKTAQPQPELAIIGKKAHAYCVRRPVVIRERYEDVYEDPGYAAAARVAGEMGALYTSGDVDRIDVAYNEMISMVSQRPVLKRLLPIELPAREEAAQAALGPAGFIFEPGRKELLGRLLPMYLEIRIYRALLESMAAEQAARMTAMDAATNNAGDMIDHLTLVYNRARQGAITNELLDIVGGAEALNE
jgi:F-type H+-transporting ATPase subunit gamma